MTVFASLLCAVVLLSSCLSLGVSALDPEVDYDAIKLITSKGYPAEAHWVITVDGYILGLHRIPHGKNSNATSGPRPVFFLQHGLLCSSTNWLTNLENESLGYILADAGYDVWMGNIRGNTYSKNHTSLRTDSKQFWDFTFDEHAQIDLPTMLDYVMRVSGQDKIFYVGHSQGTVMGFAGFTFNQSLASHIRGFFALAPVTTVKHIQGAFKVISDYYPELQFILDLFTDGEFFPNDNLIKFLGKYVCSSDMSVIEGLCENVLFLICGFDPPNTNITRLPVYYTHTPAGTSVKNAVHFSQGVKSGRFAMYDYGKKENEKYYGQPQSPAYNVSALNVPTALFAGGKDWLADPTDVAGLVPLINSTVVFNKNIPDYDHLDFIWGVNANTRVYVDIVDLAKKMLKND